MPMEACIFFNSGRQDGRVQGAPAQRSITCRFCSQYHFHYWIAGFSAHNSSVKENNKHLLSLPLNFSLFQWASEKCIQVLIFVAFVFHKMSHQWKVLLLQTTPLKLFIFAYSNRVLHWYDYLKNSNYVKYIRLLVQKIISSLSLKKKKLWNHLHLQ